MSEDVKVAKIITVLAEYFGQKLTKTQLNIYIEALAPYGAEAVDRAAKELVRRNAFMPKVAEFVEVLEGSKPGLRALPGPDDDEEEFDATNDEIYGETRREEIERALRFVDSLDARRFREWVRGLNLTHIVSGMSDEQIEREIQSLRGSVGNVVSEELERKLQAVRLGGLRWSTKR